VTGFAHHAIFATDHQKPCADINRFFSFFGRSGHCAAMFAYLIIATFFPIFVCLIAFFFSRV